MSFTLPVRHASCLAAIAAGVVVAVPLSTAWAETDPELPVQYAHLPSQDRIGRSDESPEGPGSRLSRTLSGFQGFVERGTVVLRASAPTRCVPGNLLAVVADVSARFGTVSVESTHRTRGHNWRAGGARQSLHLSCRAVDFRVRARAGGVMAYLRSRPEVGGLKIYRNGIIHIDNGERRSW
jgi:uncharacterized protein YcbK (DUF882 family)